MSHTVHSQAKTTPLIRKEIKESRNQGIKESIKKSNLSDTKLAAQYNIIIHLTL